MEQKGSLAELLDFERCIAEPLREHLRGIADAWHLPAERLRESAVGEVVDRIHDVFSMPFYKILAAGWRRHPSCRAYCNPEEYPPGESHTVELAEHTVGWECEPAVEVLADGLQAVGGGRLAALDFELEVETAVHAGLLTIRDARFIKMEAAELVLCATVRLKGFTIARYDLPVRLPGALRFGEDGEPICPAAGTPEAAVPAAKQVPVPAIANVDAARV